VAHWLINVRAAKLLVVLAVHVTLAGGCAGYRIGHHSMFRPDIQTVHIPVFKSDSLRRNIGERVTEAVAKEIERRSPYKVVSSPDADSVLIGRILRTRKKIIAENSNDDPRDVSVEYLVQVRWNHRNGDALMDPTFSVSYNVAHAVDLVAEGGQSMATSELRLAQYVAQQIVSQMELGP